MPQQPSQPNSRTGSRSQRRWRTLLGLLLIAISSIALMELSPRLLVSGSSPIDISNQLVSSKFTVKNDGYLPLTDVMLACFLWKVDEGGLHLRDSMARVVQPPEGKLAPNESFSVPCVSGNMSVTTGQLLTITHADVAISIYYRPWPFTRLRRHKLLRLVARPGEGQVVWDEQPADILEKDYDTYIQEHSGTFPPKIFRPK